MRSLFKWRSMATVGMASVLTACGTAPPEWRLPTPTAEQLKTRHPTSFDCVDTRSALQELVCEDAELAALDRDMAKSFRRNVRTLDLFGRAQLVADQQRWLLQRQSECQVPVSKFVPVAASAATACLKGQYRKRNAQLAAWPQPQARNRQGAHPLSAYVEFKAVDDREPALCSALGQQFNTAIRAHGQIDPNGMPGLTELAGSQGPAVYVNGAMRTEVHRYDAGIYASYQTRSKGLTINGQPLIHEMSLPDWIMALPNSGGHFSASSSQTNDYATVDVVGRDGREFVVVTETWGYYAAAARGESPHAAVYELRPGPELEPLCLYRTYLTPPKARVFDRLPALKELTGTLQLMAGTVPDGLMPDERRDQSLLDQEIQWTLLNMPLVVLDQIEQFDRKATLRRRHDAALEAIFNWSERNLPSKLLYRRLLPLMQPAHAELVRVFRSTQGLKPDEASAAADIFIMMTVDSAAQSLGSDLALDGAPAGYKPRYVAAPAPGDLEKDRDYGNLHSAVLNRAAPEVVADFIKFESDQPTAQRGRGPAGDTVLMAAVRSPETVTQLLAAGADVNAHNDWHKTALMAAAQANQLASAQLLLDAGAEVQRRTIAWGDLRAGGPDNQEGTNAGRTALMYAAAGADAPLLQLLLDKGASVQERDDAGRTACDHLAQNTALDDAQMKAMRSKLCGTK